MISNSEVSMTSASSYTSKTKVERQTTVNPTFTLGGITILKDGENVEEKSRSDNKLAKSDSDGGFLSSLNYAMGKNGQIEQVGDTANEKLNNANYKIRLQTMNYLLRILLFGKILGEKSPFESLLGEMTADSGMGTSYLETTTTTYIHSETQEMSFSATGTAITADGRELEFNYEFTMSESFVEYSSYTRQSFKNSIDPLVINLDNNPTSIDDQKFYFDLDADGNEDEIHRLGKGSGFLALDKNEDGIINDGMELFGPRSGDGFRELAEYDEDGNGWIDEADPIFNKLRIWTIDESGNQELYGLKESDVGAIYLGRIGTFFVDHDSDNEAAAIVRKSGIYLRESDGMAHGVQHVDFTT